MKNQLLFLFAFLCFFTHAFAQELITDEGVRLKPGIYRNFKEFVTNSPSLYPEIGDRASKTNTNNSWYKLTLPDGILAKGDSIWGFCTGRNVYINGRKDFLYKKSNSYNKILYIGRYCYFEIKHGAHYSMSAATSPGSPYGTTYNPEIIIKKMLDINDGSISDLNDELLGQMLEDNSELFEDYLAKSKPVRNQMAQYYLKQYSDLHRDDINLWKYLK